MNTKTFRDIFFASPLAGFVLGIAMAVVVLTGSATLYAQAAEDSAQATESTDAPSADRQAIDPPVRVFFKAQDDTQVRGLMTAWNEQTFWYADPKGNEQTFAWTGLQPRDQFTVQQRLIDGLDARQWLRLGARLHAQVGGEKFGKQALTRAQRMDEQLAPIVEQVLAGKTLEEINGDQPDRPGGQQHDGDGEGGGHGHDHDQTFEGPQTVGETSGDQWPKLTAEQHKAVMAQLNAVGQRTKEEITPRLRLFETDYFLFYTDMHRKEAERWAGLLDKMYHRLCELFDVPEDENIWAGKCLILVFQQRDDFVTYEKKMNNYNVPEWTAGLCWQYGDGKVHVTFYRQPDQHQFAYILVHEAVHGFLHRYKTGHRVPNWANEGLAEFIATELVPEARSKNRRITRAKDLLNEQKHAGFFDARNIASHQYALAYVTAAYMISENKKGYVEFIRGVKDGMDWRDALKEKFGADEQRILFTLSRRLGASNYRP